MNRTLIEPLQNSYEGLALTSLLNPYRTLTDTPSNRIPYKPLTLALSPAAGFGHRPLHCGLHAVDKLRAPRRLCSG